MELIDICFAMWILQKQPLEVFYEKVFLKLLQSSNEITCVGVSWVEDTNSRIESVIHMNFLHSDFARFPKNISCKTCYGKNVLWDHESASKNHKQLIYKLWFWSSFFYFYI